MDLFYPTKPGGGLRLTLKRFKNGREIHQIHTINDKSVFVGIRTPLIIKITSLIMIIAYHPNTHSKHHQEQHSYIEKTNFRGCIQRTTQSQIKPISELDVLVHIICFKWFGFMDHKSWSYVYTKYSLRLVINEPFVISHILKKRFKCVIGPCTFNRFWHWSLHFFLFGIGPCTL
jgi:hypothetical protein